MLTYFLVFIFYSIKIIKSTCVNNTEPFVGDSIHTDYVVQLCALRDDGAITKDRLCIRSIDGTANYSPYLDTAKDYPNIFFTMEYVLSKENDRVKLINVKNGKYLASLSNGFIYYAPTDHNVNYYNEFTTWILSSYGRLINLGVKNSKMGHEKYYLCSNDNYSLKLCENGMRFAIITTIFSRNSILILNGNTPVLSSVQTYDDSEKWSLEFKNIDKGYCAIRNIVSGRYLTHDLIYDNGKVVACRIMTTDICCGTEWSTFYKSISTPDRKVFFDNSNSNLCTVIFTKDSRIDWYFA